MNVDRFQSLLNGGRPIIEPLSPPSRKPGAKTHRVSVKIDHECYLRFRAFVTEHGITGSDVALIAIQRLIGGRL